MKKILLLFICALTFTFAYSQPKGGHHHHKGDMGKEVLEFKIKFLSQEMELTADQQRQFAQLYKKMDEERRLAFKEARAIERKVRHAKNATEADYAAAAAAMSKAKKKEMEIDTRYEKKFASFLSKKQMFKMREAEEKFRDRMRKMRQSKSA